MAAQLLSKRHYPRGQSVALPVGAQRVRAGTYQGQRGWVYQAPARWYFLADDSRGGWIVYEFGAGGCPCGG